MHDIDNIIVCYLQMGEKKIESIERIKFIKFCLF